MLQLGLQRPLLEMLLDIFSKLSYTVCLYVVPTGIKKSHLVKIRGEDERDKPFKNTVDKAKTVKKEGQEGQQQSG